MKGTCQILRAMYIINMALKYLKSYEETFFEFILIPKMYKSFNLFHIIDMSRMKGQANK